MATTLKDIAERLNISISTVSYALRDSGRSVPDEVKRRVLEAARDMNYRPNRLARSMITGRNHVIGIVPPTMYDNLFLSPYLQLALNGITNEAGHNHQDLMVYTRFDENHGHQIAESILDGRVDGAIFISPQVGQTVLSEVARAGLPCVSVAGSGYDGVVTLHADNEGGIACVMDHLIRLGHQRIAHISGLLSMDDALLRLRAYRSALERERLPTIEEWIVSGGFEVLGGFEAMNKIMDLPNRPTAVCCANDEMAIGALRAIQARGMSVPRDFSVTGFDMTPSGAVVTPPITTVRQPITELGAEAVRSLLLLVEGKEAAPTQTFPTELIIRSSTAHPKEVNK